MKSLAVLSSLAFAAASAGAQVEYSSDKQLPRSVMLGGALEYGSPQGGFASNVNATWGLNGFAGWRIGNTPFSFRADFGFDNYGSRTRRVPLGSGPLGLIMVNVNTTNNIYRGGIGLQAGAPSAHLSPYVGGSIGFANFSTESSVSGTQQTQGESFASSTNSSDGTFAKTLYGGLYVPLGKSGAALDLGLRYHWNGEARYLTEHDISFDANNNPVLSPRYSRADLLTIQVGVAYRRR
ncbi:MAG: hypothetical protein H3C62_17625 [Gemmatimonadaceae bacterium]|nr:hypothetical protein [Gemmatimonadaceae bacterium]